MKKNTKFIVEQNGTSLKIYNNYDFNLKYNKKFIEVAIIDIYYPDIKRDILLGWNHRYGFFKSIQEAKIWATKMKLFLLNDRLNRISTGIRWSYLKELTAKSLKGEIKKLEKIQDKLSNLYPEYYI